MSEVTVRVLPVRPKALSVAEFNRAAKGAIEEKFPSVWIEGEIASCKLAASGHAYFDLKDDKEEARVSCCLFKNMMSRVRAELRDGERVVVRARASLYPARGSFQLIVDTMLPAGAGAAAAALEALKRKLAAEGLFTAERKRPLPRFPRAVGVVTSGSGAAFADICRVALRRWPARIVLAPTLVQGAEAPARIVAALAAIQRVPGVEVVIVGRGGGASDDLTAFQDERVARAIAACAVPVISAVGHEIDHTLADLVADVRAATPSQAAELAVPELTRVRGEFLELRTRSEAALRARINARRVLLTRLEKRLGDPRRITDESRQRLDELLLRAQAALRRRLALARKQLEALGQRLARAHPSARVVRDRGALAALAQRLAPAFARGMQQRTNALEKLTARLSPAIHRVLEARRAELGTRVARLEALSPLAVLSRGYAVVLHEGKAVTHAAELQPGDTITVRLHQGTLDAAVRSVIPGSS